MTRIAGYSVGATHVGERTARLATANMSAILERHAVTLDEHVEAIAVSRSWDTSPNRSTSI